MRASELLGCSVHTPDGSKVGHVFDIEAARTGPQVSDAWGKALRVSALLVGPRAALARLGYLRRQMSGPMGLRFLARRATGYVVTWEQIERIGPGRIDLNCAVDALETIRPPA